MLKNALLAASLAALAVPAAAQTKPSKRGEAASLETAEADRTAEGRDMRDDNRGRLTTASHRPLTKHSRKVSKAVHQKAHHAAAVRTVKASAQHHPAQLQTGQLTTTQTSRVETKETALHRPIHSDSAQDRKLTSDAAADPQNKSTHTLHLKKHNARMF